MDVNTDPGLPAGDAEDQVGTFRSNAAEGKQDLRVTGETSAVFGNYTAANLVNMLRFGFVESASLDALVNFFWCEPADLAGGSGNLKQPTGCGNRDFVAGTDRNNAGNELFERRVKVVVGQLEHGCFCIWADGVTDKADCEVNIKGAFGLG
jgi:hypothetical protein